MHTPEMPRAIHVAASFSGFPFAAEQMTTVKRGEIVRGPLSFLAIAKSIRIGDFAEYCEKVGKNIESIIGDIDPDVVIEDTYIRDPIILTDFAWHRIYNKWFTVDDFAESWIPPMASGRQLGYLKGLIKKAGVKINMLDLTSADASSLISELKTKMPKESLQHAPPAGRGEAPRP